MEIIRESYFDEKVAEIIGDYSRMDELDSAIDWALRKDPIKIPNILDLGGHRWVFLDWISTSEDIIQIYPR